MSGLRDRKKQEVRHRMIGAAAGLFAEKGLDDTTMEDIATAANVSVGTVYNYFGTKSALLLAGVEEDTDRMIAAGQAVLADPGPDVIDAVKRLVRIYVDELAQWDSRLLRELMVAALERIGGDAMTAEIAQQDQRLIEQMTLLVGHFHAQGQLATGVEVMEAVMLLFSVIALHMFVFMSLESAEVVEMLAPVDRQIELVFTGIAKESE